LLIGFITYKGGGLCGIAWREVFCSSLKDEGPTVYVKMSVRQMIARQITALNGPESVERAQQKLEVVCVICIYG
jgi:hypothetical protein